MPQPVIDASDLTRLQRLMSSYSHGTAEFIDKAEVENAYYMLREIQRRAPRETGAYAHSWKYENGLIFTMHPAANRLEYGFIGIDSLGRHYSQKPQPHIRPATKLGQRRLNRQIRAHLRTSWRLGP